MTQEELEAISPVTAYIRLPAPIISGTSNVVAFTAKGAKHFKSYGIREGSLLVFDLDKDFCPGHPSCFVNRSNKAKPRFKMSKKEEPGFEHVGRFVAAFTDWSD